ncbi:hypothetical protein FGB62_33g192 [Gracilaria domingensis]|nr:hypothetical protein FGB62_33g192 [Gracilaria domingensis]
MAFWKPSVARLTAFFERESRTGDLRDIHAGNESEVVKSLAVEAEAGSRTASLDSNTGADFESMVHDVWGDLMRHARDSQGIAMDQVFTAAGDNLAKKQLTNVAEQVYRRELIAVLEAVSSCANKSSKEDGDFNEEQAAVNSLKRRLSEMSKEAKEAKEALQVANKDRCDLEYVVRTGRKAQEAVVLVAQAKKQDAEIEKLQAEKSVIEVEKLRALHKAEMTELVAKQSSLYSRSLDMQLKNMERSSSLVQKHVEGLERVVEEITNIHTNAVNSPESSRSRWLEGQVGSLVRKSSQLLGKFRGLRSRDGNNADESERNHTRRNEEETEGETEGDERADCRQEPPAPRIGKRASLGMFLSPNRREPDHFPPRLFRKLTSRLRRAETEQNNGTEAQDGRDAIASRDGKDNRALNGGRSLRDDDDTRDTPQSGTSKTASIRRILSRGVRRNPEAHLRAQVSDPEAVEYMSKTLEKLEKNFRALRDVYETKEEELYRLNGELRNAIKLSDAFEKGMKSEFHKRMELEKSVAARPGVATDKKIESSKKSAGIGERTNSVRDKVTVALKVALTNLGKLGRVIHERSFQFRIHMVSFFYTSAEAEAVSVIP